MELHHAGGNVVTVAFAINARHAIDCEFQLAIDDNAPLFAVRVRRPSASGSWYPLVSASTGVSGIALFDTFTRPVAF